MQGLIVECEWPILRHSCRSLIVAVGLVMAELHRTQQRQAVEIP